jgi:hypothetical protein
MFPADSARDPFATGLVSPFVLAAASGAATRKSRTPSGPHTADAAAAVILAGP